MISLSLNWWIEDTIFFMVSRGGLRALMSGLESSVAIHCWIDLPGRVTVALPELWVYKVTKFTVGS